MAALLAETILTGHDLSRETVWISRAEMAVPVEGQHFSWSFDGHTHAKTFNTPDSQKSSTGMLNFSSLFCGLLPSIPSLSGVYLKQMTT